MRGSARDVVQCKAKEGELYRTTSKAPLSFIFRDVKCFPHLLTCGPGLAGVCGVCGAGGSVGGLSISLSTTHPDPSALSVDLSTSLSTTPWRQKLQQEPNRRRRSTERVYLWLEWQRQLLHSALFCS
jgi:hypothetical protein